MRRRPRRRLAASLGALAVVLAAGGGLAACSDDDGRALPGPVEDAQVGPPVDGGTLRLALPGGLVVDPALASPAAPDEMLVADLLHRGLTELDEDGRARPGLAEAWSSDPTARTWTFTLDPDARFASGRAVVAADVVASLERVLAGGDRSVAALRLEDVQGFRPFLDGTTADVAGLRAVDPTTVEIALDQPLAVLPELLAAPSYGVVDAASLVAATALAGEPGTALAGLDLTGGWVVREAEPGRLLLARLPGTDGHLEAVELRSYPDAAAAYEAFEDGAVHWAPVPADRVGTAAAAHGDRLFAPFQAELLLGLRVGSPALSSEPLRQAIVAAVDADAVVRGVYPDAATVLRSLVPSGVPGWRSPTGRDPGCAACRHDPVRARTLLREAFPDGKVPTVAIDTEASAAQQALARVVAGHLEAVGIPTTVRPRPLEEHRRLLVAGGQEVFTFGWVGGYASPAAYLEPLFRSGAADNLVGLASPEVDALLAEARAATDPPVRAERWAAVERLVLDAAVVVPIAQFRTQVVAAPEVRGLRHAVDGTVDWAAVWLADHG